MASTIPRVNREISTTCDSVESRLSQVWHCEPGKITIVLINRTLCSMVVWRRCSGCWCRTNEGQGSTRVLLQTTPALWDSLACSPALQAHTQDCSRHTGSAYSSTRLPTSNKTAAHKLLVLQIKHKAQSTNSRF